MSNLSKQLKGFELRVRVVRSWRGMAMGACLGAGISTGWAVLDWRGVLYTEWSWMGATVGALALLGVVIGFLWRVPAKALTASIDRRAGLDDRLTTADERWNDGEAFDDALRADAEAKLSDLKPNRIFPIRLGRWHGGTLALSLLAAAIFLLGNTPLALSQENRHVREELKKQGQNVERVTKQNFETPDAKEEMSAAEKRLADEMRKFQRDLEKAHISKEDALQKANDLAQKANELMKDAAKSAQQSLEQAQTARSEMEQGELQQSGLGDLSPQMASMPEGERQQKLAQARKEAAEIQQQLDALRKKLEEINKKLANPNLTPEQRKELEAEKKGLERSISALEAQKLQNQSLQKALELSKEAQEVFKKMMNDPLYKKLLEIEKKLAQDADTTAKTGQPKLTDEERRQLKEQLEKLAASLKDPKAMKAYLEALIKAMEEAKRLGRCNGASVGINGLLSMGGQAPPGPGAPTEDIWQGDNGHVYKLDKAAESKGTTTTSVISGNAREATGPQAYVEIKAPSLVGNRSSVPYQNILPSYKKKAESALDRQQIPKEHQKRVKEYFESLTGSKKG